MTMNKGILSVFALAYLGRQAGIWGPEVLGCQVRGHSPSAEPRLEPDTQVLVPSPSLTPPSPQDLPVTGTGHTPLVLCCAGEL